MHYWQSREVWKVEECESCRQVSGVCIHIELLCLVPQKGKFVVGDIYLSAV